MPKSFRILALGLLLAGCRVERRPPEEAAAQAAGPRRDVLKDFKLIPMSVLRDTTVTPDAQQKELTTLVSMDSVRRFFRAQFDAMGWSIQSSLSDATQATMYATKDSSAVWVRTWVAAPLTWYSVIGTSVGARRPVLPDSTHRPAAPARPDAARH